MKDALDRRLGLPTDADLRDMYRTASPATQERFDRIHRRMLIAAIAIKGSFLAGLIYWNNFT